MLETPAAEYNGDSHRCTFVNVNNGRFVTKQLPVSRLSQCISSTKDGLLVFEEFDSITKKGTVFLCNPFTLGKTGCLYESFSDYRVRARDELVVVFGKNHSLLYILSKLTFSCWGGACMYYWVGKAHGLDELVSAVEFQGQAYLADVDGTVAVLDDVPASDPVIIVRGNLEKDDMQSIHLVNNGDQLLLLRIRGDFGTVEFCKVDLEHKVLEKVKSICNRAIFLGARRHISVKADMFHAGIEGDSLYMDDWWRLDNEPHHRIIVRINKLGRHRRGLANILGKGHQGPESLENYMVRMCHVAYQMC